MRRKQLTRAKVSAVGDRLAVFCARRAYFPSPLQYPHTRRSENLPADSSPPKCALIFLESLRILTWDHKLDFLMHDFTSSALVPFGTTGSLPKVSGQQNCYATH
ncbi:hypothetical protein EVAR_10295_1 [Eumeta japonica]|uniref:Uncharacterized protein n=1 Tax=Eumeta variegata TaxID=151549 RepID=A0A4C1TDN7_EUMVA|nr:hypothetical protein EVAR_10295_1 [Eumeta japonica]